MAGKVDFKGGARIDEQYRTVQNVGQNKRKKQSESERNRERQRQIKAEMEYSQVRMQENQKLAGSQLLMKKKSGGRRIASIVGKGAAVSGGLIGLTALAAGEAAAHSMIAFIHLI